MFANANKCTLDSKQTGLQSQWELRVWPTHCCFWCFGWIYWQEEKSRLKCFTTETTPVKVSGTAQTAHSHNTGVWWGEARYHLSDSNSLQQMWPSIWKQLYWHYCYKMEADHIDLFFFTTVSQSENEKLFKRYHTRQLWTHTHITPAVIT